MTHHTPLSVGDDGGGLDLDLGPVLHESGDLQQGHGGEVWSHYPAVGLADFPQPAEDILKSKYQPSCDAHSSDSI